MNQKELAAELGLSRATISNDVTAGMPMSSAREALAWRRKNRALRSSRQRNKPAVAKPRAKSKRSRTIVLGDDWLSRVSRAREMEKATYAAYVSALQSGEDFQLERLQSAHGRALRAVAEIEELAASAQLKTGDTLRRDEVEATLAALLMPLNEALQKLPLGQRTNCNPEHPEIAFKALTEWRDRFLVRVNKVCMLYAAKPPEKAKMISHPVSEVK